MTSPKRIARDLAAALAPTLRDRLGSSPIEAIIGEGIRVGALDVDLDSTDCSCDGIYYRGPPAAIGYRPTPGSRRERFTLLHEFGHHLVRHNYDALNALADCGDDGGRDAEEQVCDALAGSLLIPESAISSLLDGSRPLAEHVQQLHKASDGSLEACAVRLAERLPGFGYVAFIEIASKTVRFAGRSPSTRYPWRRGTPISDHHPIWRAEERGAFRGQGPVVWPSGARREFWIDAVASSREIHAVFAERRYWDAPGISALEGGFRRARPMALQGSCRHCGAHTWGYRSHDICGDTWCRSCGRCGCGASEPQGPEMKTCKQCGLTKRATVYADDTDVCIDCR